MLLFGRMLYRNIMQQHLINNTFYRFKSYSGSTFYASSMTHKYVILVYSDVAQMRLIVLLQ